MSADLHVEITSPPHFERSQLLLRIAIVAGAGVPHWILAYQRGVLRWQAGVLAYHASIVAHSLRWTFDTHDHVATAA